MPMEGIGAGLAVSGQQGHSGGSRGSNRGGGNWRRNNNQRDDEDKSKLVCSYCKKKKHTKESCFELIGYPDWWEEKHEKPPPPPPPPRTPWNHGGGHAAAVTGEVRKGDQNAASDKSREVATSPAVNKTRAANLVTGGSGSIVGDWSEEQMVEEAASSLTVSGYSNRRNNWMWH
ncbi:uncharacterized protein LOC121746199 [Salvia splendens]|uniref:uncharacterized protein LOC121746199 n=1 Tax=Salvia splendens TaxID=180675 RepID=UPI001C27D20C|nr:uncharacterized protein LOC121746199 [Salvia splendens]